MPTTNTNNPFTEVSAIVLAALMIIAGGLLLYVGKVDFTQATLMFGLAVTIYGGNLALKAPSPGQASQLIAQMGSQQQLLSQMVNQQGTSIPIDAPQTVTVEPPASTTPGPQFVPTQQQSIPTQDQIVNLIDQRIAAMARLQQSTQNVPAVTRSNTPTPQNGG